MAYQGSTDIFNDGWREPGDDCERLAHYIIFAIGTLGGLAMFLFGVHELFTGTHQGQRLVGLLEVVVGGFMGGGGVAMFASEAKHWDLRHMTADRVVAGGFLFGFALMLLGAQIASRTGSVGSNIRAHQPGDFEVGMKAGVWLIGAGAADLTLFLVAGLAFAFAPQVRIRKRMTGVRIERRYAVDEKLNEIDDRPCPRADGLQPVVVLRLRDGRTRTLVCAESAYELVQVGRQGTAVVRGKRMEGFL